MSSSAWPASSPAGKTGQRNFPGQQLLLAEQAGILERLRVGQLRRVSRPKCEKNAWSSHRCRAASTSSCPTVPLAAKRLASGEWLIVLTNSPELRPPDLSQALHGRVPVRRRQDPRPQSGGQAPDRSGQDRHPHLHPGAGHDLDLQNRIRCHGHGDWPAQSPWSTPESWFRTGFNALHHALLNAPQAAASLWADACPKRSQTQ